MHHLSDKLTIIQLIVVLWFHVDTCSGCELFASMFSINLSIFNDVVLTLSQPELSISPLIRDMKGESEWKQFNFSLTLTL